MLFRSVYLAADRPLDSVGPTGLRVELLKRRRWPGDLFPGAHVHLVNAGCACELLRDGTAEEEASARSALLDQLDAYLQAATTQGPIQALVCWAGDERKSASVASLSVAEFRDFDFDSAWDAPTRLTISRG